MRAAALVLLSVLPGSTVDQVSSRSGIALLTHRVRDGFDFREDADHNAGSMVRGVVALRIDPMPPGIEEFDYRNGGWAFIDAGQVIIYGHGVR
jgi:hypothetical protein